MSDSLDEMRYVCPVCNHNKIYHTFIKEMGVVVCKVKTCKCMRSVPNMMTYNTKLLEELK